jgi:S1-C subfamily serine protease
MQERAMRIMRTIIGLSVVVIFSLGLSLVILDQSNFEAEAIKVPIVEVSSSVDQIQDPPQDAQSLEDQIASLYEALSPSVVHITSTTSIATGPFGSVPQEGTGSGFIYDEDGHILTNFHVIEGAQEILVTFSTGEVYAADVTGTDELNDLAILSVAAEGTLPDPLVLADSDELRVGQFVLAIGNPYGLDQTLTTGVVSALGRVIQSPEDNRFIGEAIQTDAAINPGNSGGPLLDLDGQVIGINSQILSASGASAGIGFAVSSATIERVVPELINTGTYAHPWLGISMLDINPTTAKILREAGMDVPIDHGILIMQVSPGSPADEAGLKSGNSEARVGNMIIPLGGDIIIALDGNPMECFQDLTVYMETEVTPGESVLLTILRDGVTTDVLAVPIAQP